MAFISDVFLVSGAFAAAIYCLILSRRLRKFTNLESDIGKAVGTLSSQIDALNLSLQRALMTGDQSVKRLEEGSERAEVAARHLELLVASLHSLPAEQEPKPAPNPFLARRALQGGATQ